MGGRRRVRILCGFRRGVRGRRAWVVRNSTSPHGTSHMSHWSVLCCGEKLVLYDRKAPRGDLDTWMRRPEGDVSVTFAAPPCRLSHGRGVPVPSLPWTCRPRAVHPHRSDIPCRLSYRRDIPCRLPQARHLSVPSFPQACRPCAGFPRETSRPGRFGGGHSLPGSPPKRPGRSVPDRSGLNPSRPNPSALKPPALRTSLTPPRAAGRHGSKARSRPGSGRAPLGRRRPVPR